MNDLSDPALEESWPRKRNRLILSCLQCRHRKVKCDRKTPCTRCLQSQKPCKYDASASDIVVRSGMHVAAAKRSSTSVTTTLTPDSHTEAPQNLPQAYKSSPSEGSRQDVSNRLSCADGKEQATSDMAVSNDASCAAKPFQSDIIIFKDTQVILEDRRAALNKDRLYGQSHWATTAFEFRKMCAFLMGNAAADYSSDLRQVQSEIRSLLDQCKQWTKSSKATRPSRRLAAPASMPEKPSRHLADRLSVLYIKYFESAFRILHVPSFWREYEHYWNTTHTVPPVKRLKIELVMAIGASIYQDEQTNDGICALGRRYVYAAQNWLAGPLEKDRLSLDAVQVQCLLVLARQLLSVGGDLTWVYMGNVLNSAMQIGLHRDPDHFGTFNTLQSEIRRRLWFTVLELLVQSALDSGMPVTLSGSDFDTRLPMNIDDDDLDRDSETLSAKPRSEMTDTSIQLLLNDCLGPRLEIVKAMNGLGPNLTYERVLRLSSLIESTCRTLSDVEWHGSDESVATFRRNLVSLLLNRFLLSLHRPFANRARTEHTFYYSRKISLDAAMQLLYPGPDPSFMRLVLVGGGIFKFRMLHSALAVSSELLADVRETGRNLDRWSSSARKLLIDGVRQAKDQALMRIRLGESNVRLHMELSVTLSKAEASNSKQAMLMEMALSAKESLQSSFAILRSWSAFATDADNQNASDIDLASFATDDFDLDLDLDLDLDAFADDPAFEDASKMAGVAI